MRWVRDESLTSAPTEIFRVKWNQFCLVLPIFGLAQRNDNFNEDRWRHDVV